MKKKRFYLPFVAMILSVVFSACTADITVLPLSISLSQSSAELAPGETITLIADVTPNEAAVKTVAWSSSDPAVCEVSDGIVTAIAEGTAIITATTNSGNISAICLMTVFYPVSSVSIERAPRIISVGRHLELQTVVFPEDAPDKTLIWSSSNSGIATVDNGIVTAISPGTVIITAMTAVGQRTANFELRVLPEQFKPITLTLRTPYAINSNVSWISFSGNSMIYFDWGDEKVIDTYMLNNSMNQFIHTYTILSLPYTVTILADEITNLICSDLFSIYYLNLISLVISESDTKLTSLNCANTRLSNLDVSGCETLAELICNNNQLNSLDFSNNIEIQYINCMFNNLSAEAINAMFRTLHDNQGDKSILITGNPGINSCDRTIATNKGWLVF